MPLVSMIPVERIECCLLCQGPGSVLYEGLNDRLYGVPITCGYAWCRDCGLVWLDPRPTPQALGACYPAYKPHQAKPTAPAARRFGPLRDALRGSILAAGKNYPAGKCPAILLSLGKVLNLLPQARHMASFGYSELVHPFVPAGKLLEIGCGAGAYLGLMQRLGWDVRGVDFSPMAAETARKAHGVDGFVGRLQDAGHESSSFDAVSMNHAIEHIDDLPILLNECLRVLKPGGRLVLTTPNLKSLAHRIFGRDWLALDSPRHLWVFSSTTLGRIVERAGFSVHEVSSRVSLAAYIFDLSLQIRRNGVADESRLVPGSSRAGRIFAGLERLLLPVFPGCAEELMLVAVKPV